MAIYFQGAGELASVMLLNDYDCISNVNSSKLGTQKYIFLK